LQYLWDRGEATTRQLTDVIHPEGTASHYATVQKLLERLEGKKCVSRDRSRWPHVFAPIIEREDLIGQRLRTMAEKLCGGSLTPLLTHLLKVERLSPRERDELRAFMDELDAKSRPKGRDT
ncbi:MAG TPA: BlaI/MecI/CopY family transcriptional regulator, partial [Gemmataceae bacterium]|nr:BlaI/MecI/CopY family transcriptional regulator [Gemmataceae bacterium]